MTTERDGFSTSLPGIDGAWPQLPDWWSYSSLTAATECPRRWMLARASYPKVWEHRGYPPRPVLPALVGSIIHQVLETILSALHAEGCTSVSDPQTVAVLKGLGGYTALLEHALTEELDRLRANPRASQVLDTLATALRQRLPDMRQRVQAVIARAELNPAPIEREGGAPLGARLPLAYGTHPEIELRVPELRFVGRADLLSLEEDGCTLTDYKTGSPDPHHLEQLRIYSLLWSRDGDLNPGDIPTKRLVIAYATHNETHDPPSAAELDDLADGLTTRIRDVESDLDCRPPPAKPVADMCRMCAVRHLCDDYWPSDAARANSPAVAPPGTFVDCEATVVERNGPRSWLLALEPDGSQALLRTPTEATLHRSGDRVRMLDIAYGKNDDNQMAILTMTQTSEAYLVRVQ